MEMHRTCEEPQSDMDRMIKQVELLSVMIRKMPKNRAGPKRCGKREEEEGTSRTEVENSTETAVESKAPLGTAEEKRAEPVRRVPQGEVQTPDKKGGEPMSTMMDKEHVAAERPFKRTKVPRKEMSRFEWSLYWLKLEAWPELPEKGKLPLLRW